MEALAEAMPLLMFAGLAIFLFSGYPVAFVLGGIGLIFALITIQVDDFLFSWDQFGAIPSRIYGNISVSLILTAIPMFIFMGTMLERSGIARDLLNCLQVLLRRVPGGLALAVTLMGTILAATTGIIGASVVMMSLLALPVMMARSYSPSLASGTIAASGTLGILISAINHAGDHGRPAVAFGWQSLCGGGGARLHAVGSLRYLYHNQNQAYSLHGTAIAK